MSTGRLTSASSSDDTVVQRWLSSMSLEDQMGQMAQIEINMLLQDDHSTKILNKTAAEYWMGVRGIGSVLNTPNDVPWTAQQYRRASMELQEIALAHNRPPVIWGLDSVHGANYVHGAIVTPQPLCLAASFNTTVALEAGRLASRDTRAAGINWLFSPLLGIAFQPLWSRVYETFGEDPLVVGVMAQAMIQGIQEPQDGTVPSRAAACAKHFIGYSLPRNGHDRSPSWIPTRHLYQYFVPPWQRAVGGEDGALTVMESYSETDGVPNVANRATLYYLLRQRLQFEGVLVTDYSEILNLQRWHQTAASDQQAVLQSLREGSVDMSMIPWNADGFMQAMQQGVDKHSLSRQRIQTSAERVLQVKHQLGMFDERITMDDPNLDKVGTDEELALDMARQGMVLTQNRNNLLPLQTVNADDNLRILVTGPTASSLIYQSGGWTNQWQGATNEKDWFTYGTTVLSAFSEETHYDVSFSCGTDILGGECDDEKSQEGIVEQVEEWVGLAPHNSIGRAVDAAQSKDVVVLCLGEEAYTEKPGDIRSLHLPQGQYELVRSIKSGSNAKIVVVYFGGRTRLLKEVVDLVDAVLIGFLPGPSAGQAVADIVTGRVNPSGRLPVTYPMYEDGGGMPYFHTVSDKCTKGQGALPHYENAPCEVQWAFGHGLSYTTFEYSALTASGGIDKDLTISATIKNTGKLDGSDAVLFFSFDEFRIPTPENKLLRIFEKVYLRAGEETTIKRTIPLEELKFIGPHDDRHYIIDPTMTSWVGVGAATDCRDDPYSNDLCARIKSDSPGHSYVPACHAACELWSSSGCMSKYELTANSCLSACVSISEYPASEIHLNNDGWGWDYVNCLESVIWGRRLQESQSTECWKMTALCRDIFATGKLNEYGIGPRGAGLPSSRARRVPAANYIALSTAMIASAVIIFVMRGGSLWRARRARDSDDIQFTRVENRED